MGPCPQGDVHHVYYATFFPCYDTEELCMPQTDPEEK